jgi:hypothetical protein
MKTKEPKRFQLSRSPIWGDPNNPSVTTTRMPEPDLATKIVDVLTRDELCAEAQAFADEVEYTCQVFIQCLARRTFPKAPWLVYGHRDRIQPPPWDRVTGESISPSRRL